MITETVALAGPPCSGKSTVGKILAGILSLPLVETDMLVEQLSGRTIPGIFSESGQEAFRELESAALRQALAMKPCVLALGGGSLLRRESRELVTGSCRVFTLMAETGELLERNFHGRPLAGNREAFQALLQERRSHYLSLPGQTDTSGKTAAQVAREIGEILRKEDPSLWSP